MRAREIHVAAEQLASEPLRWSSVKGTLAAYAEGSNPRFERVPRGYYRIREHVVPLPGSRDLEETLRPRGRVFPV